MSRVNANLSSVQATNRRDRNHGDLSVRLRRLAGGMKIDSGRDAPAAFTAGEALRNEIAGIGQAIDHARRADNVINTAAGAVGEVNSLLLGMQSLTDEAANTAAPSPEEVEANQLRVDAILANVNRIANTPQFGGVKLPNGPLDFQTSVVTSVNTTRLGSDGIEYLPSMACGGTNSLDGGNTIAAQNVPTESTRQVATLRGRLGAFQTDMLETSIDRLTVALENVTSRESAIHDAHFFKKTAALTRAQILAQANTSVPAQADGTRPNVLSLWR